MAENLSMVLIGYILLKKINSTNKLKTKIMENKIKITVLFAVIISLFSACSNDEPTPPQLPDDNYEYSVDSLKDVAFALVKLQPTIEMCKEVHAATQKAISLGLDETYYFVEMLGKGEQITKSSEIKREILSKLATLPEDNNIKQLFDQMSENNSVLQKYQIYWPYSERWDGKEMPTITFKSKESPLIAQEENIGYLIKGEEVEDVLVNEEYAKTHPVWIINTNPIPYDEYPDFAVRNWSTTVIPHHEFFEDREWNITKYILYVKGEIETETTSITRPAYEEYENIDYNRDTLSLYLKNVSFDRKNPQLHSLFAGSPHYIFNLETVDIEDINPADYKGKDIYVQPKTEYIGVRFVFLRSEMNAYPTKMIDQLLSWRWLPFEGNLALTILQEFGGKSFILPTDVTKEWYMMFFNFVRQSGADADGGTKTGHLSLGRTGFIPLRINDELLQNGDCYRDEYNYYALRNSRFYDVPRVTKNITCELDVTKGISNPSWYTPVEE